MAQLSEYSHMFEFLSQIQSSFTELGNNNQAFD